MRVSAVKVLNDVPVTRDKSLSAQFEHTIGVTEDGFEILPLVPSYMRHPTVIFIFKTYCNYGMAS